ncbi:membrane protein [Enterococcus faecium]|nr:membrane protein [Enterococcus faecium]
MKIVETKFYGQLIVVSDYILLGILWVIVCLPVITIVPATCAVFYVMAQWKGEGSGNIIYFFFQGIKQHFGKNLFLSLLTIIIYFLVNQLLEEQTIVLSISGYVPPAKAMGIHKNFIYVISENKDITFLQIFEQSAWKVFFDFLRNILCCVLLLGFVLLIFLFPPFIFIFAGGVWKLVSIILTIGNER